MSEKKYTILISGIACLLALVLTLCSVIVSHAEESDSDCKKIHEGKWSDINDVSWLADGMPHADAQLTDTQLQTYPKSESFTYRYSSPRYGYESIRVGWKNSSDQPLLVFLAPVTEEDAKLFGLSSSFVGSRYSVIISKDQFCFNYQVAHLKTVKDDNGVENTVNDASDVYMSGQSGASTKLIDGVRYYYVGTQNFFSNECDLFANSFSCFTSAQDAIDYLKDGDASKIAFGKGSKSAQKYNSDLAFTSFDMSVHDSNSFDDYYIDFLYKCPQSWLGKDIKLLVNQTWDYNVYYFDIKEACMPVSLQGANQCSLSISDTSVRLYLKDLKCFDDLLSQNILAGSSSLQKRLILGEGGFSESFSLGGVPIKGSASTVVDKSLLSLSCVVYVDGVAGHDYIGSVDLITGDNSMATYTPDSSGNYTYNNDYKKGGHYYTNVGKDAAGNTTYNYYYYNTDNSKHEVTSKDSHDNTYTTTEAPIGGGGGTASGDNSNNNVNNPTFNNNNNITIEGDTINNDVNNIVGSNTSTETNKNFIEKFLGFFQLLENNSFLGVWGKVFGWLPPGISSVITTALGIGACVGLFRFFRR